MVNSADNTLLSQVSPNAQIEGFITELIDSLKADRLMFQTDVAPDHTREKYRIFSSGNDDKIHEYGLTISRRYFVTKMFFDLMSEIDRLSKKPSKLAVSINVSSSKINFWVEINDDDDEAENALYMAEAKINAIYQECGFYVSLIIVEKSDNFPVPNKYREVPIKSSINN